MRAYFMTLFGRMFTISILGLSLLPNCKKESLISQEAFEVWQNIPDGGHGKVLGTIGPGQPVPFSKSIVPNTGYFRGKWGQWYTVDFEKKSAVVFVKNPNLATSICGPTVTINEMQDGCLGCRDTGSGHAPRIWLLPNKSAVTWGEHRHFSDLTWSIRGKKIVITGTKSEPYPCDGCQEGIGRFCGGSEPFREQVCKATTGQTPGDCLKACEAAMMDHFGFNERYVKHEITYTVVPQPAGDLRMTITTKPLKTIEGKSQLLSEEIFYNKHYEYRYLCVTDRANNGESLMETVKVGRLRGKVTAKPSIRLRSQPGVTGEVVATLLENSTFDIGEIGNYETIGGIPGFWVKTKSGAWLFDGFVSYIESAN